METESNIFTVGEFVSLINESLTAHRTEKTLDWREHHPSLPLQKRFAAAIAHRALLDFIGEEDEENWTASRSLRDLYDCRTCVIHIAQMYCKGIIDSESEALFGAREMISKADAENIISRLWDRTLRLPPSPKDIPSIKIIEKTDIRKLTADSPEAVVITVTNENDEDLSIPKSTLLIPFSRLLQNPYQASDDLSAEIFIYSEDGYLSHIAADILSDHGYGNITVIKKLLI